MRGERLERQTAARCGIRAGTTSRMLQTPPASPLQARQVGQHPGKAREAHRRQRQHRDRGRQPGAVQVAHQQAVDQAKVGQAGELVCSGGARTIRADRAGADGGWWFEVATGGWGPPALRAALQLGPMGP